MRNGRNLNRGQSVSIEEYFDGREDSKALFAVVREAVTALGEVNVDVTKSQVAFRRTRSFAWAWIPGRYLSGKVAPLVLTLALDHRDDSPRWKDIVEPKAGRFTHHLEVHSASDIDEEVRAWLREAWALAA